MIRHMFSAAVTQDGQVYSFGHAEYNQHGTGGKAYSDYTDPYFYFTPQQVKVPNPTFSPSTTHSKTTAADNTTADNGSEEVEGVYIESVSCGSNYTIGIDRLGRAFSWGWNESGVLGMFLIVICIPAYCLCMHSINILLFL